VYSTLRARGEREWWRCTRVTHRHFIRLLSAIQPHCPDAAGHHRRCNPSNQLLLVIMWLAGYPTLQHLAMLFGVSESAVWRTVHYVLPALVVVVRSSACDLSNPALRASLPRTPEFPQAIGIIDCTHHDIETPQSRLHEPLYYRRDQAFHTVTTQVIVDLRGKPIHVSTGYPGSCHDLRVFRDSGAGALLQAGEVLLGDQGYLRGPFISPFSISDPDPTHRYFNGRLSHWRIRVEQCNRYLKRWRALATRWRGGLPLLSAAVVAVAGICAQQLEVEPLYTDV